jgi:hypothetical protein
LRIAISISGGNAAIGGLLVAAASLFAMNAAAFESQIWPGRLPAASAAVSLKSSARVEGSADTVGGWVLISYGLSVDCSPPRACYTALQRVYAYANCSMGSIREIQRISLDLNGNVVAETGERAAYIPPRGSVDRAVVRTLCEVHGFYYRRPWWGRDGDSDSDD